MFEELVAQLKRIADALWQLVEVQKGHTTKGLKTELDKPMAEEAEDFGLGDAEPKAEEPAITQNDVIDAARLALKADKAKFVKLLAKYKVAKISELGEEYYAKALAELKKIA